MAWLRLAVLIVVSAAISLAVDERCAPDDIQDFVTSSSNFSACLMQYAIPLDFCQQCNNQYNQAVNDISALPDECTTIAPVDYFISFVEDSWLKSGCASCSSDDYVHMEHLALSFFNCSGPFNRAELPPCNSCESTYTAFISAYNQLSTPCSNSAQMTYWVSHIQNVWIKYNCDDFSKAQPALIVTMVILALIPVAFYLTVWLSQRKKLARPL